MERERWYVLVEGQKVLAGYYELGHIYRFVGFDLWGEAQYEREHK